MANLNAKMDNLVAYAQENHIDIVDNIFGKMDLAYKDMVQDQLYEEFKYFKKQSDYFIANILEMDLHYVDNSYQNYYLPYYDNSLLGAQCFRPVNSYDIHKIATEVNALV